MRRRTKINARRWRTERGVGRKIRKTRRWRRNR